MTKRPSAPVSPPSVVPTICTWACPTGCWFAASVTRTATRPCWAWAANAVATNATAIVAAHRTRFDGKDLILTTLLSGGTKSDPALPGRSLRNRSERLDRHDPCANVIRRFGCDWPFRECGEPFVLGYQLLRWASTAAGWAVCKESAKVLHRPVGAATIARADWNGEQMTRDQARKPSPNPSSGRSTRDAENRSVTDSPRRTRSPCARVGAAPSAFGHPRCAERSSRPGTVRTRESRGHRPRRRRRRARTSPRGRGIGSRGGGAGSPSPRRR